RGITEFARAPNGGLLVVGPTSSMTQQRALVVTLAAKYRLPAAYHSFAFAGALLANGANSIDQYRRAAGYVDRIFKGEKPANLPGGSETGPGQLVTWVKSVVCSVDAFGFKFQWTTNSSKHILFDWTGPGQFTPLRPRGE